MKIILIGAGKLGGQLYKTIIYKKDLDIIQWVVRSSKKTLTPEGIPIVQKIDKLQNADIYLLAVSDNSILKVSKELPNNAFIVHTAGAVSLDIINQKRTGVFYPLQSFSIGRDIDFSSVPIIIESKIKKDLIILKNLAKGIKASFYEMNSKQRAKLHLSAIFVNNFTNHLFSEAALICKNNDIPFNLLKPLIQETIDKLETMSPKAAQTGPAIRNDKKTISNHLDLIKDYRVREIYKVLTLAIEKSNVK